jgi:hypothetical protein
MKILPDDISRQPRRTWRAGVFAPVASLAFSLIEIMVTIALLSIIVLGLLSMFNQTQRAFRSSMTQTDVLESGRIVMEMLGREIEQMTPSHKPFTTNFFAEIQSSFSEPLYLGMPGTTLPSDATKQDRRTNWVQRVFFLIQTNQDWVGIGYQVIPDYANGGVGTLYRYSATANKYNMQLIGSNFLYALTPAMSRMADGVIHFKVQAYATNGYPITPLGFRLTTNPADIPANVRNTARYWDSTNPDQMNMYFMSNAVPAYVEVELAVMEPRVYEKYRAIGAGGVPPVGAIKDAQRNYLSNHIGQVHVFRQRIPVRNVDFAAYK